MTLSRVLDTLTEVELQHLRVASGAVSAMDSLRAPVVAALSDAERPTLVITPTRREADQLVGDLEAWAPDAQIVGFPAWETLPHERLSPSPETVGQRYDALARIRSLESGRRGIVVASVRAAVQVITSDIADVEPVVLRAGSRGNSIEAIIGRLIELAYTRVDMVTRRGEFASRGGILDVFSPAAEHPVRAEFFGDEIEQMRWFRVADQRSSDDAEEVVMPPSRELLLTESVRQRAKEMQHEFPAIGGLLEKLSEGIPAEGMESLAPALVSNLEPITALMPGTRVIVMGHERVRDRIKILNDTNREFLEAAWSAATAGAEAPIDLSGGEFIELDALASIHRWPVVRCHAARQRPR